MQRRDPPDWLVWLILVGFGVATVHHLVTAWPESVATLALVAAIILLLAKLNGLFGGVGT